MSQLAAFFTSSAALSYSSAGSLFNPATAKAGLNIAFLGNFADAPIPTVTGVTGTGASAACVNDLQTFQMAITSKELALLKTDCAGSDPTFEQSINAFNDELNSICGGKTTNGGTGASNNGTCLLFCDETHDTIAQESQQCNDDQKAFIASVNGCAPNAINTTTGEFTDISATTAQLSCLCKTTAVTSTMTKMLTDCTNTLFVETISKYKSGIESSCQHLLGSGSGGNGTTTSTGSGVGTGNCLFLCKETGDTIAQESQQCNDDQKAFVNDVNSCVPGGIQNGEFTENGPQSNTEYQCLCQANSSKVAQDLNLILSDCKNAKMISYMTQFQGGFPITTKSAGIRVSTSALTVMLAFVASLAFAL
ncbi:hypothetical protein HDU76_002840 [Blyttiomyces sp. JEL0837]|nr:hypothetical protein HDU76_002840 [Blyttiomyces sp. JEL0837]